jgi:protein gp37
MYGRWYPDKSFSEITLHLDRFDYPFPEQPARKIFVGSMSDIMLAPFDYLLRIFDIICDKRYTQHTFQILTKRPEILIEFDVNYVHVNYHKIWAGISAENQEYADLRIPILLKSSFDTMWVSLEPLLDSIDLSAYINALSWVVVGGETGPHARPMNPIWVRNIRNQCIDAHVPFFFKSWGEWAPVEQVREFTDTDHITRLDNANHARYIRLGSRHTGRMLDGKEYQEFPITERIKV